MFKTIKELYEEAVRLGAEDYEIEAEYEDDFGYHRTFYINKTDYNELTRTVTLA